MLYLTPNQQYQSTEGKSTEGTVLMTKKQQNTLNQKHSDVHV